MALDLNGTPRAAMWTLKERWKMILISDIGYVRYIYTDKMDEW